MNAIIGNGRNWNEISLDEKFNFENLDASLVMANMNNSSAAKQKIKIKMRTL
jgi:hypothetical protein